MKGMAITGKLPAVTRGYEHINRYWDRQMQMPAAKLMPGEVYVSHQGEMIVTVLGSCVAACIRDRVRGVGGMNHFMLPEAAESSPGPGNASTRVENRYGNWAMEFLINEILKLGGDRRNLEIKIFGGGRVLDAVSDIGQRNIVFVRDFLRKDALQIAAEDVGGVYPRKVLYFPDTGAAKVRKLKTLRNDTIVQREASYRRNINVEQQRGGDVELF